MMAKAEAAAVPARARSGGAEITLGVGGPEELRELARLSEAEFGFLPDRSSEEYYRWQYYDNPAGRAIVASAWSLGELVGHYAVVPVRVVVEGRETTAGIGVNAIIKKEFQGRAIFARLVVSAEQAATRNGIDFHYVVPSPESHPWFVRLLRY
ncbi:MAG: GNAT family N-acetyltransferase, partial [bacterium]